MTPGYYWYRGPWPDIEHGFHKASGEWLIVEVDKDHWVFILGVDDPFTPTESEPMKAGEWVPITPPSTPQSPPHG